MAQSVKHLPSVQIMIPESRDRGPHRASCTLVSLLSLFCHLLFSKQAVSLGPLSLWPPYSTEAPAPQHGCWGASGCFPYLQLRCYGPCPLTLSSPACPSLSWGEISRSGGVCSEGINVWNTISMARVGFSVRLSLGEELISRKGTTPFMDWHLLRGARLRDSPSL